ncbi:unnamed protein product [Rotaria sp. Silwood1]|nr:unnamed protein product [Rotaria sp. Silwood1]CAF1280043.1 unnamed protein product [Rotaria sp. Silwood1]CAF3534716.1 unnamed protein product [Rotaria sp. Silwood1]CAF4945071.1 unnamed protein product [Rotaria sp. Silwood1]
MLTYNNVLGNFISYLDDLSDLDDNDDDDYEDSVSESEFEIKNPNKLSQTNVIDERSLIIESLLSERRGSMSLASSESSLLTVPGSTRTRRMSTTKVIDQRPKHLMLGDFELANVVDCEEYVLCCKYSPIGDVFAVGLGNGTIKVYSKPGQFQYVLTDDDTKTRRYPVTCLKFYGNKDDAKVDHQKMLAATYTAGYVKVWHYPTQQCVFTFDEKERQPLALDFNCNYTRLYVAGSDCVINCYDFATKKLLRKLQASESRENMDGHKNRIHAIRSHPAMETVFLTGGWDETVHYWDERAPHSQKHFAGPHLCGDALDIIAEHQVILTGSWRRNSTLQIWDFSTGELIKDAFQNNATSMLYCTKFSPKEYILCAGNDKNEAIIYDYSILQMVGGITDLENAVYCADTDVNRPNMIVGSAKNIFIVNDKSRHR